MLYRLLRQQCFNCYKLRMDEDEVRMLENMSISSPEWLSVSKCLGANRCPVVGKSLATAQNLGSGIESRVLRGRWLQQCCTGTLRLPRSMTGQLLRLHCWAVNCLSVVLSCIFCPFAFVWLPEGCLTRALLFGHVIPRKALAENALGFMPCLLEAPLLPGSGNGGIFDVWVSTLQLCLLLACSCAIAGTAL
jgi:hypothetical protein